MLCLYTLFYVLFRDVHCKRVMRLKHQPSDNLHAAKTAYPFLYLDLTDVAGVVPHSCKRSEYGG